jgi:WD40 repeat protein
VAKQPPPLWFVKSAASAVCFSPDGKEVLLANPKSGAVDPPQRMRAVIRWADARANAMYGTTYPQQPVRLSLVVLDARTGRQLRVVDGGPWAACHALSPRGDLLAAWDFKTQTGRIVETTQGKEVWRIGKVPGYLGCLLFSHDGKVLAGAAGPARPAHGAGTFLVWDARTGREVNRFTGHADGFPAALALAPNGRWLASAGRDHTVRLWDVQTGKEVPHPFTGHQASVSCLLFTTDGKRLIAGSEDGNVLGWDVAPWTTTVMKKP